MHDYAGISKTLTALLGLKRRPIAITLLPERPPEEKLTERIRFCEMWSKAMEGETVYATEKEEACGGGAYFMGLADMAPEQRNGTLLSRLYPLYATPMAAVRTNQQSPKIPQGTGLAVMCCPLEKAEVDADVVLMVCDSLTAMKLVDAALFETGGYVSGMTGPATCSVAVAYPYLSGQINYCLADVGAREYMKLARGELIVSIPGDKLVDLVINLERTTGSELYGKL
jgi:uncharacterized protein (DUF169 family)